MNTAGRFEVKLGNQVTAVNNNSAKLLSPARPLSVDETMVKFYRRSVLRKHMPAKQNKYKYGVKLWTICHTCGYSLTQDIYLGGSVESVGARHVVMQLAETYLRQVLFKPGSCSLSRLSENWYCQNLFHHCTTTRPELPRDSHAPPNLGI